MNRFKTFFILFIVFWLSSATNQSVQLPFSFSWGNSLQQVHQLIEKAEYVLLKEKNVDTQMYFTHQPGKPNNKIWGYPIVYFETSTSLEVGLYQIKLHYAKDQVNLTQIQNALIQEWGKSEKPLKWEQGDTQVSVVDSQKVISVIYLHKALAAKATESIEEREFTYLMTKNMNKVKGLLDLYLLDRPAIIYLNSKDVLAFHAEIDMIRQNSLAELPIVNPVTQKAWKDDIPNSHKGVVEATIVKQFKPINQQDKCMPGTVILNWILHPKQKYIINWEVLACGRDGHFLFDKASKQPLRFVDDKLLLNFEKPLK